MALAELYFYDDLTKKAQERAVVDFIANFTKEIGVIPQSGAIQMNGFYYSDGEVYDKGTCIAS